MAKINLFFCILFYCCVLFANPANKYYEKGLKTDNSQEKIKFFSIALKVNPDFHEVLLERARSYYQINNMQEALTDLRAYAYLQSEDQYFFVLQGKIYQKKGMFKRSLESYNMALKLNAKNDEALFRKGILLITLGGIKKRPKYYEDAATCLKDVSSSHLLYKVAISQAAQCLEYFQKYDEVLDIYQQLISINSDNSSFYFNLGRLLYMAEDFNQASLMLQKASDLTFKDGTYNEFYGIFNYYVTKVFLKEDIAADYHLNIFFDKLPRKTLVSKLFQKDISPQKFLDESLEILKEKNLSKNLKIRYEGNVYCQLGYFYLSIDNVQTALEYFTKSKEYVSFGAYYFYLANYEEQRLLIEQKNNLS